MEKTIQPPRNHCPECWETIPEGFEECPACWPEPLTENERMALDASRRMDALRRQRRAWVAPLLLWEGSRAS